MIASELIFYGVPPLKNNETIGKALNWMNEFKQKNLIVLDNSEFLGIISEDDILDSQLTQNITIKDSNIKLKKNYIAYDKYFYDAMNIMNENDIDILAILDKNNKYLGLTTLDNLNKINSNMNLSEHGSLIVIKMKSYNYSLVQIAQLIEINNAKILNSQINKTDDDNNIELTLKINIKKISPIITALQRYGYNIIESYHEDKDEDSENILESFDNLMNFIDK